MLLLQESHRRNCKPTNLHLSVALSFFHCHRMEHLLLGWMMRDKLSTWDLLQCIYYWMESKKAFKHVPGDTASNYQPNFGFSLVRERRRKRQKQINPSRLQCRSIERDGNRLLPRRRSVTSVSADPILFRASVCTCMCVRERERERLH